MRKVKIGDTVRYLNAAGGGIVRRIEGKVAWVEGEDGFELPTPLVECIPVEEGDSFIPGYKKPSPPKHEEPQKRNSSQQKEESSFQEKEPTIAQKPATPMPHLLTPEREGGNELSIYLAWLPVEANQFGSTPLECYLINDSNYMLHYQLWAGDGSEMYRLIAEGELERDTKLFIEELPVDQIYTREKLRLSYIPFKRERSFVAKPAQTILVGLNMLRLIKKHAYQPNDFFDEDALVVPIVEKDSPCGKNKLTKEELQAVAEEMAEPNKDAIQEGNRRGNRPAREPRRGKRQLDPPLEVDLHMHHLVETTAGLTPTDMLQMQLTEFRTVMNDVIHNKGQRVVFIHGKGDGVLRKAILDELKAKFPKVYVQDASFKEYGFGATMVTIR